MTVGTVPDPVGRRPGRSASWARAGRGWSGRCLGLGRVLRPDDLLFAPANLVPSSWRGRTVLVIYDTLPWSVPESFPGTSAGGSAGVIAWRRRGRPDPGALVGDGPRRGPGPRGAGGTTPGGLSRSRAGVPPLAPRCLRDRARHGGPWAGGSSVFLFVGQAVEAAERPGRPRRLRKAPTDASRPPARLRRARRRDAAAGP